MRCGFFGRGRGALLRPQVAAELVEEGEQGLLEAEAVGIEVVLGLGANHGTGEHRGDGIGISVATELAIVLAGADDVAQEGAEAAHHSSHLFEEGVVRVDGFDHQLDRETGAVVGQRVLDGHPSVKRLWDYAPSWAVLSALRAERFDVVIN